jgi:membrane-associated phospholipid phosphatase
MPQRVRLALFGALCAGAGFGACAFVALQSARARSLDAAALAQFMSLGATRLHGLSDAVVHLADPLPFALIGATLVALAVLRGRPRVALAIAVMLPAATLTTEILKQLLAESRSAPGLPNGGVAAASFPSGHATASMALALALVLAVPARLRPAAATLGALLAVAVSYALLTLGWHFPSDVFGGYLVACCWTLLAVAALFAAAARWPARSGRRAVASLNLRQALLPPALALVCVAALVALAVVVRPAASAAFAHAHPAALLAGLAIAGLALLVALATAIATSQRR